MLLLLRHLDQNSLESFLKLPVVPVSSLPSAVIMAVAQPASILANSYCEWSEKPFKLVILSHRCSSHPPSAPIVCGFCLLGADGWIM